MPKIEYCNQCGKPKDKHFGDNCRCNFQWEYKPTSITPENEKLSTLGKCCEKCSGCGVMEKKEYLFCKNESCPCHTEPKEYCKACEYQKKIMTLPFGVFHTCKSGKGISETKKPKEVAECKCEEMTCKKDCNKNHTHKTFWCENCKPEMYQEPLPQANEWVSIEKEFYNLYLEGRKKYKAPINYIDYFEARHFITKTLATQKAKDREDVIKDIEEEKWKYHKSDKKFYQEILNKTETEMNEFLTNIHNQALSDILNKLKNND